MPECPLADECPSFSERIEGMGCQHYGDRGGAEWCSHYSQPIRDLKQQPVQIGEEVVVDVEDIHESGAGVGRTEDGFIVMVDGVLPDARAKVKITEVRSNHARADEVERLPMGDDAGTDDDPDADDPDAEAADEGDDNRSDRQKALDRERLGSRENFWGN
ncbi:TRAM domain protein [Natronomonas moolapensis 8.8.11]|uniref:TRAM domain protein n=1 Tax=Natronomonas moolapensis (strain DSM 18674 / CECT 7526 / JCM 14361 / 8.8.11) TaxID=268739 RepID=M1XND2_NATM8|nr:TRAM domain-containing protein [Natronomonas moolapensis]CCQ35433.1 TRAM domain protein [Natronomonas moolapensis 8.8.11]